jgi:hypothetical protein
MSLVRRGVTWIGVRIPGNLSVFVAAIFLSNCVNVFTTIYAVPGKPVHSAALICSCGSSLLAAGLWTALASKKELIEKAVASGASRSEERERLRAQLWDDIWLRALIYLCGAVTLSILALVILVVPPG